MKKIILAIALVLPMAVSAQKFGHVNTQELFAQMPEVNAVRAQMDTVQSQYESQLAMMQEEFQKKVQDFQAQEATLAEAIKQPVSIPAEGAYIGFTVKTAQKGAIIATKQESVPGQSFIIIDGYVYDASTFGYGPVPVLAIVSNIDLQPSAWLTPDKPYLVSKAGKKCEMDAVVTIGSPEEITSFTLEVDNGEKKETVDCTFDGKLQALRTDIPFSFTYTAPSSVTTNNALKVKVTKINNAANTAKDAELKMPLMTVSRESVRHNVGEIIASTTNGNSPLGWAGNEEARELYKEKYIGVVLHQSDVNDPMYIAPSKYFQHDGKPDVDLVLTTQEIITMIKESGIRFTELEGEAPDLPFGMGTGAATIFGTTGGVAEAVARRVVEDKSKNTLQAIQFSGIRGSDVIREVSLPVGDRILRIAVVHGLVNAKKLLKDIEEGVAYYDLVEVMTCKTGCVGGAGQPYGLIPIKQQRAAGLYEADRNALIKRSESNPIASELLKHLGERSHELLHVHYSASTSGSREA